MRVPQAKQPRRSMRIPNPTQPATPKATAHTTGPQGTPGGRARKPGVAGKQMKMGQEVYLWIVILVELALTGALRKYFRKFHGG